MNIEKSRERYLTKCPCCDNNLVLRAKKQGPANVTPDDFELVARRVPPDAPKLLAKPPAVGDWIIGRFYEGGWSSPEKVSSISSPDRVYVHYPGFHPESRSWLRKNIHIVRLRDAPLEVGDWGLLDGKIEVWVRNTGRAGTVILVFSKAEASIFTVPSLREWAWIDRSRFTLVEPVFEKED